MRRELILIIFIISSPFRAMSKWLLNAATLILQGHKIHHLVVRHVGDFHVLQLLQ